VLDNAGEIVAAQAVLFERRKTHQRRRTRYEGVILRPVHRDGPRAGTRTAAQYCLAVDVFASDYGPPLEPTAA